MATQQINNIKDQLLQIIELSESSSEIINDLDNNNINSKIKEICVLILFVDRDRQEFLRH